MKKKTIEEIKPLIEKKGFTLISKVYVNNSTKLDMICSKGHKCQISWGNFNKGRRCSKCSKIRKLTLDEVKSLAKLENYMILSEKYNKANDDLEWLCPLGHDFIMSWGHFQNGERCTYCAKKSYHTLDIFAILKDKGYMLDKHYKLNNRSFIEYHCEKNHTIEEPLSFLLGKIKNGTTLCPICRKPRFKGEEKIEEILIKKGVYFIKQKKFDGCIYNGDLRFDFYIPCLNLAIEYDGRQHFEPVDIFGGEEGFKITKERDSIKNNYCEENNITLLRIPYWDFDNIEDILDKNLIF